MMVRSCFGERTLEAGTVITIDGRTGEVFEGSIPSTIEVVPEARTLLVVGTRGRHRRSASTRASPRVPAADPSRRPQRGPEGHA